VEGLFCELPIYGVLRTSHRALSRKLNFAITEFSEVRPYGFLGTSGVRRSPKDMTP
jgi:hypothetical protein